MALHFNERQSVALAILPKIVGAISIMASILIIITVARDSNKRNKTYHRLLVGISCLDVCSSFWQGLSMWPMPAGATAVWGARGNDMTCSLQCFFTQFCIVSSCYSASLSLSVNYSIWLEGNANTKN
jgi:hypothetical protein